MPKLAQVIENKISSLLSKHVWVVEGVVIGYHPETYSVDVEYFNPHGTSFDLVDKCRAYGLSLPQVPGVFSRAPEPNKTGITLVFLGGNLDYPLVVRVYDLEPDISYEERYVRTGTKRPITGIELGVLG